MINNEIASCVARFFDATHGPPHDELSREFRRFSLDAADPRKENPTAGKKQRVREVLEFAVDNDTTAGDLLVSALMGLIKAAGGFRSGSEGYAGDNVIQAAREAFRSQGFELDFEGNLRTALLEDLSGPGANDHLQSYVRRARTGSDDAALVIGTGKDLLEATARHVLVRNTGGYPDRDNFPMTLHQAFDCLHLATSAELFDRLNRDPHLALQESLFLLGNAVNRLRNAEGPGHGQPFPPSVTAAEAGMAIQAMGLVSQMLLDALQ